LGGLGMIGILYQRLAVLGVSFLAGPTATAGYSSAARLVEGSKTAHVAIGTAAYPLMAENEGDRAEPDNGRTLQRIWHRYVALGAAVSAVLLVAGPWLVDRLYGAGFAA